VRARGLGTVPRILVVAVVLTMLTSACGTRRSHDEIAAAGQTVGLASAGQGDVGTTADGEAGYTVPEGGPVFGEDGTPAGGVGADEAMDAEGSDPGAPGQPAEGTAPADGAPQPADPGAGQQGEADHSAGQSAGPGAAPPPAGAQAAAAPGTRATIRIGVVGTLSGVGGTQRGSARAVQAWAQWRTANGGLGGHPVEVIVVDDGGDPARFRSALQELVEQRGVVAFVGNPSGFTLTEGAVSYLESKRVPVIGGDRLGDLWNSSAMLFPQASAGDAVIWNHMVNAHRLGGDGAAVGWVTCQEAQICRDADRLWQEYAPALGLDVRYRAQVSVAQPNFTAECTRAMQAGVEHFILGTDANSIRRLANDCARQGYHPSFGVLQTSDDQAREPALDGGYFASATFPWVAKGTPATREFHQVMETYAPNVELSAHASSGWVAAKLFERAAQGIADPSDSAQILEGLWSIRDETLGGLTSALTFVRDQPAPHVHCFFAMHIRSGAWALDADELRCRAP
jgi:branched-chain amino acid transport system substrate-binding protein